MFLWHVPQILRHMPHVFVASATDFVACATDFGACATKICGTCLEILIWWHVKHRFCGMLVTTPPPTCGTKCLSEGGSQFEIRRKSRRFQKSKLADWGAKHVNWGGRPLSAPALSTFLAVTRLPSIWSCSNLNTLLTASGWSY